MSGQLSPCLATLLGGAAPGLTLVPLNQSPGLTGLRSANRSSAPGLAKIAAAHEALRSLSEDQPAPLQVVPDQVVPDQVVPDQVVPDQVVPDH